MSSQVADYSTLFSTAWAQYKTRGLVILAVLLISTVLLVMAGAVFGVTGYFIGKPLLVDIQNGQVVSTTIAVIGVLVFLTIFSLLCMWSQAAILAVSVDESLGIMAGLRAGWRYLWSLAWVSLLLGGVMLVGFFLAFIPGVIFLIWFSFSMYIMVDEDKRGLDALLASKGYVEGYWWNTFGKFFVIWLLSLLVSVVPFVGQILSLLFTPFLILFLVNVYKNLKEIKSSEGGIREQGGRTLWGVMAGIGLLVPIVGLLIALGTLGPNLNRMLRQIAVGGAGSVNSSQSTPPFPQVTVAPETVEEITLSGETIEESENDSVSSVLWQDPAGDVGQEGVQRWLDIKTVSVIGQNDVLMITVTLNNQLAAFYNAGRQDQPLGRLISLYIDSDVNRDTGGAILPDSNRTGYDISMDVILEAKSDMPDARVVHVPVSRIEGKRIRSLGRLVQEQVTLSGKEITLHFPYEVGGLTRGDQVRLCYRELAQGRGEGLSKDKLIILP